jgi:tocopherol cyclase
MTSHQWLLAKRTRKNYFSQPTMIRKKTKALFNSDLYHGWHAKKNFFEGWYYKCVNADATEALAIIPGVAMDGKGEKQAFIQILDGIKLMADYIKFPFTSFQASKSEFEVEIENNAFTRNKLKLDLLKLKGELKFQNQVPWPSSLLSPGIMGPFSFVPFMECYHGILSLDHSIEGALETDGRTVDFSGGRGYMEKDWGSSFPSAYFWMQSNHFSKPGISVKASVAKIPWLTGSFVGFIAGVYFNKQLIQFTTYNRTKLIRSVASEKEVEIVLKNNRYKLCIKATKKDATELASPIGGFMDGRIKESMTSHMHVQLYEKGKLIFDDIGMNTGLEVAGEIDQITIGE